MEQLFSVLEKFLSGSPKTGWTLFILGTVMLSLDQYSILPAPKLSSSWQAALWLCTFLGATILIVSFGAWCFQKILAFSEKLKERSELNTKSKQFLNNGLMFVPLLPIHELKALIWILSYKEDRFIDKDLLHSNVSDLLNRSIIFPDNSSSATDFYFVNPLVWHKRLDIIGDYDDLVQPIRPW